MTDLAKLGIEINTSGVEQGIGKLDNLTQTANRTGAAADSLNEKLTTGSQKAAAAFVSNADRITAAANRAGSVMSRINATTGVTGGSDFAARGADVVAYGRQLDDLRAKYVPLYAAGQTYKDTLAGINQAAKVGAISEKERAAAIMNQKVAFVQQVNAIRGVNDAYAAGGSASKNFTAGTAAVARGAGLARHELINMSRQIQDVGVSLASGQSPLLIAVQQGTQIADVFASSNGTVRGFFGQLAAGASRVLTPMRLVAAGAAGIGAGAAYAAYAWSSAQKEIERSLIGIGSRTGTTISDINKFASANASATGLSVDQARSVAIEFTKIGNVSVAGLKGLGDAVHGYAVLTGTDATNATKALANALSGDLVKGAQELNKTYGFLNPQIQESIRNFQMQGERGKAVQVIIDAIAKDNQRAAESVDVLTKAWNEMWNAASAAKNAIGDALVESPNDELARLQKRQARGVSLPREDRRAAALIEEANSVKADGYVKEMNRIQQAGDAAMKAIIPQIEQLHNLEQAIADMERAKATVPVGSTESFQDNGATDAAKNLAQATREAIAEAERYNQRIQEISGSWGGVSQSTALALQAAQNQLPVIQAVTGATQMAAQYAADYASAMDRGKSSTDAAALAAANLANAQAVAVAGVTKQTIELERSNRLQQAGYVSTVGMGKLQAAQAQAEAINNQKRVAGAQAYERVIELVGNTTEGIAAANRAAAATMDSFTVAAARAADQVKAIKRAMLEAAVEWQRAMIAAQGWGNSLVAAGSAPSGGAADFAGPYEDRYPNGGTFNPDIMTQGPGTFAADPRLTVSYRGGGGGQKIVGHSEWLVQQIMNSINPQSIANQYVSKGDYAGAINAVQGLQAGSGNFTAGDQIGQVDTLTQLLNAMTSDKGTQVSNLQSELAWLNTLPQTIARDQKIVSLQQSIDQLKNSTDGLNSTMGDLLSPYYSQDPRTSKIGFRSQGMAMGGYVDVPGAPSANDNMIATIPIASGERIYVDPMPSKRGVGGGTSISISMPITIQGNANKDEIGRTMFQAGQALAKQLGASR